MIPRFMHTHKKETIWVYHLQNTLLQVSGYAKDDKLTFRITVYLPFLTCKSVKTKWTTKTSFLYTED